MTRDFGVNQALVEEQYLRWTENPQAVDAAWRRFFDGLDPAEHPFARGVEAGGLATKKTSATPTSNPGVSNGNGSSNGHHAAALAVPFLPPTAEELPFFDRRSPARNAAGELSGSAELQGRVTALVNAYRVRGHLFSDLDPLHLKGKPQDELKLERFGLAEVPPETLFSTGDMAGPVKLSLAEIVARLRETYCRSIGVEFTFLEDPEARTWLQERMEASCNRLELTREEQLRILTKLTDAENFEQFLHTNYMGAKRFSLEGAESFIPLLDLTIERSGNLGVEEVVVGMAHRGRLNVLANIMGMKLKQIFAAFEDELPEHYLGRGDVKYHLGYSSDRVTEAGNKVHLTLSFNPSHLEFVNPVVEGRVRAKQERRGDAERSKVLPLLVHGDAAFVGQGVVAETLNLAQLEGYFVGGTLHVVINNQVGFTTSPNDSRSCRYCTDITRMLRCPVFHVNGEDPEAVAQVVQLATEYRQRFQRDVVIDLYCYRKHGHNETDEPRFTQPVVYATVDAKRSVREVYADRLIQKGLINAEQAEDLRMQRRQELEAALQETRNGHYQPFHDSMAGVWQGYEGGADEEVADVSTGVARETLEKIVGDIANLPSDLSPNPKVLRLIQQRRDKVLSGEGIDWGTAEWLAFGSLLLEGTRIRLTGQDSRRGTFSHRHAVVYDVKNGKGFTPLNHLASASAKLEIFDSPLSEAGVLGFEYGYSLDSPDALVLWEAQFGDFVNSAQVIIDQFISSSEDKWHRLNGLVLLLPHGFEGQGPEHSSARLERFLALCAEDNMQVCNISTPAQYFHCLRRQVLRPWRKPLVIMTPKSLLRHPRAISSTAELASGDFQRVLADPNESKPKDVKRVLLCSGKVYYDLVAAREQRNAQGVSIVRLEQLYPLRKADFDAVLGAYSASTELVWVQEEPWNMGAWYYLNAALPAVLGERAAKLRCVSRAASASPATGSLEAHKIEQKRLVDEAFAGL